MSEEDRSAHDVDLTPHSMAPDGADDANAGESLLQIAGFVGSSPNGGQVRLYLDLSFASYYEVATADVVRTKSVDDGDPDSPRILWVKPSAQLRLVRTRDISGSASFVTGALRESFRANFSRELAVLPDTGDPSACSGMCLPQSSGCGSDWCMSAGVPCPPPTSGVIFTWC